MKQFAIFILFSFCASASAETLWEQYLAHPTPENAIAVNDVAYTSGAIPENYGYWAPDFLILKNQILGGDSASFNLALRLLAKSNGGGLHEELVGVVASAIRPKTNMFLKGVSNSDISNGTIEFILNFAGLEYVDRINARNFEIEMRQVAISLVKDKNLQAAKERCLELIKEI